MTRVRDFARVRWQARRTSKHPTPNAQFPTTPNRQLPNHSNSWALELGLGVVGSGNWALGVRHEPFVAVGRLCTVWHS